MTAWLAPVRRVLDEAGAPLSVFFRDDDVGWVDERLFPLLDLFAARGVPLDLAVIPRALTVPVAGALRARLGSGDTRLAVHMHGFAHVNHEPAGRRCEFGPARDPGAQRWDLQHGREQLAELLGNCVEPFFTPPWNRCSAETGRLLVELGFRLLSRDAGEPALDVPGLVELPIQVDWQRRDSGPENGLGRVAERLARAARGPGPAGVMLHHAHLDAEERQRLDELLALVSTHERVRCCTMGALAASAPDAETGR